MCHLLYTVTVRFVLYDAHCYARIFFGTFQQLCVELILGIRICILSFMAPLFSWKSGKIVEICSTTGDGNQCVQVVDDGKRAVKPIQFLLNIQQLVSCTKQIYLQLEIRLERFHNNFQNDFRNDPTNSQRNH